MSKGKKIVSFQLGKDGNGVAIIYALDGDGQLWVWMPTSNGNAIWSQIPGPPSDNNR